MTQRQQRSLVPSEAREHDYACSANKKKKKEKQNKK
jgi:hypothetical protein